MTVPPGLRVVVVDDDAVSRLVLGRILHRLGHAVFDAADVASGLATALSSSPDLVLSDFFLPDGTGDDLLVALRRANLSTPFVLVTGVAELDLSRSTPGVEHHGEAPPLVAASLTKPVDSRAVSDCLRVVFDAAPAR